MIPTDFKGITWVGDIYQKFETMCLELEEDMYRDTVEYVEDQVQTVGASVKKLYSDVLQDLIPLSSIDPVKVTVADLSLNPCTDFGTYKKPKASMNKDRIKVDKQVAKDSKRIAGVNADHTSFFSEHQNVCHFLRPSSLGLILGGRSELCSEKNEDKDTCEYSNVDIKIKSKRNNHPSSAMLWPITPGSKDLIRASLCHQLSNNHEAVCDHKVMTLCSASVEVAEGHSRGGKFCNNTVSSAVSIADAAIDIPTSDEILPIESCVKKETKLSTYTNGGPGGFSAQSNGTCTNSGGISPIELYACGDAQYIESAIEEDVSSLTGGRLWHAFIGIGFRERPEAYDFQAALHDHMKYLNKKKTAEEMEQQYQKSSSVDYSLKDGETLVLQLKNNSGWSVRSKFFEQGLNNLSLEEKGNPKVSAICIKPLPPPPAPLSPVVGAAKSPSDPPSSLSLEGTPDDKGSASLTEQSKETHSRQNQSAHDIPDDDFGDFQTAV